jgi:hypothetical protein
MVRGGGHGGAQLFSRTRVHRFGCMEARGGARD